MIRWKRQITILLMGILLAVTQIKVYASEQTLEPGRVGSITITLRDHSDQSVVKGASFTLYKVADAAVSGSKLTYVLTEQFQDCGENLENLDEDKMPERLAEYALKHGCEGKTAEAAPERAVFRSLEQGLYLVVDNGSVDGYYPVSPFLTAIPSTNANGTKWIYDLDASPKVEAKPIKKPDPVSVTARKVWENKKGSTPSSVKVALICNNTTYDTVELNQKNGWKYTWSNLDATKEWSVKEIDVPKGYAVSYERNGNVITVTNARSLIQTGQLIWPIPVLAGGGILLFATGWILFFGKRKNNHAE